MAFYTVHVPSDAADETARADRTMFIREGFSRWAFVFGWFFLLWHRLWIAAAIWVVAVVLLAAAGRWLGVPAGAILALVALMHLFVGIEGNELRRWRLDRRRFRLADVVSGSRRDEAETVFFHRQPQPLEEPSPSAVPARVVAQDTTPAVIGMFPETST